MMFTFGLNCLFYNSKFKTAALRHEHRSKTGPLLYSARFKSGIYWHSPRRPCKLPGNALGGYGQLPEPGRLFPHQEPPSFYPRLH